MITRISATKDEICKLVTQAVKEVPGCRGVTEVVIKKRSAPTDGISNWEVHRIIPLPANSESLAEAFERIARLRATFRLVDG